MKMTNFHTHPIDFLKCNPILLYLTEHERNYGSWSRIDYHVFLSRFNKYFSLLDNSDKELMLVNPNPKSFLMAHWLFLQA